MLQRPASPPGGAPGLMPGGHFQVAYATTDVATARPLFEARYGITRWQRLAGPLRGGPGHIHVELAWVAGTMIELLCASGAGSDIYRRGLPDEGFAVRHHHLGFLVADDAGWDALAGRAAAAGTPLVSVNDNPGFLRSGFVDDPLLGHHLEYILPEPAGLDFFRQVPVN